MPKAAHTHNPPSRAPHLTLVHAAAPDSDFLKFLRACRERPEVRAAVARAMARKERGMTKDKWFALFIGEIQGAA